MDNLKIYNQVKSVPDNAQKPIQGGRLKGFTDINPMWRIKMLTELFGPVGIGWYFDVIGKQIIDGANDEKVALVDINLYVKDGEKWSKPIFATGGSMFIAKEKNGLHTSDECMKMALTDAIGGACKNFGIGADVYWDQENTKYSANLTKSLSEAQIKRLYAIAGSKKLDSKTVDAQIKTRFNKEVKELTKLEYDNVCKGYESIKIGD